MNEPEVQPQGNTEDKVIHKRRDLYEHKSISNSNNEEAIATESHSSVGVFLKVNARDDICFHNIPESFKEATVDTNQRNRQGVSEPRDDNAEDHNPKWTESFQCAFVLWLRTFLRVTPILLSIIIFLGIYYIPALMLTKDLLALVEDVLYNDLRIIMRGAFSWISYVLIAADMFSFRFTKNAIIFALGPGYVVDTIFDFSPGTNNAVISNVKAIIRLMLFSLAFYIIHKSKQPKIMDQETSECYKLTKDGSVSGLFKAMLVFFLVIIFLFMNVLVIYVSSPLPMKFALRFIVYPTCFTFLRWAQKKVISNLSTEQMDRRLLVYKTSNHHVQFTGRILTSNISTGREVSFEFVVINLTAAILEVISTVTFEYRTDVANKFHRKLQRMYQTMCSTLKGNKLVPIVPNNSSSDVNDAGDFGNIQKVESEDYESIEKAIIFRSKYIYDNIASEIFAIFLAPFLMYFTHTIIDASQFQSITSLENCFYQIIIQIAFELIADVSSLAYGIQKGHMRADHFMKWAPMNTYVLFFWSVFSMVSIHGLMAMYSDNHN